MEHAREELDQEVVEEHLRNEHVHLHAIVRAVGGVAARANKIRVGDGDAPCAPARERAPAPAAAPDVGPDGECGCR